MLISIKTAQFDSECLKDVVAFAKEWSSQLVSKDSWVSENLPRTGPGPAYPLAQIAETTVTKSVPASSCQPEGKCLTFGTSHFWASCHIFKVNLRNASGFPAPFTLPFIFILSDATEEQRVFKSMGAAEASPDRTVLKTKHYEDY